MSDHWEKIAKGLIRDRIEAEGLIFGFMAAIEVGEISHYLLDHAVSKSKAYLAERSERHGI